MCLDFHNPAESMEVASDCNSSFSPNHHSFDVVSWVTHGGGRGGGFVPGLSPRMLSFLIHVAPVAAQFCGPHSVRSLLANVCRQIVCTIQKELEGWSLGAQLNGRE